MWCNGSKWLDNTVYCYRQSFQATEIYNITYALAIFSFMNGIFVVFFCAKFIIIIFNSV